MTLMNEFSLIDCSQFISNKLLSPELPGNLHRSECLSIFWAGYTTTANGKAILKDFAGTENLEDKLTWIGKANTAANFKMFAINAFIVCSSCLNFKLIYRRRSQLHSHNKMRRIYKYQCSFDVFKH